MSPWVPRILIVVMTIAIGYAIYSVSVGEGGPTSREVGGVNEVRRVIGGMPQEGAYLGLEEAPVTVTVFNDIQCTECADFEVEIVDELILAYEERIRDGDLRFEFRHFSVAPNPTTRAAIAAEAAGEQDRQWQYLDVFVRNQDIVTGEVTDENLREVAETVEQLDFEFELETWEEDLDDPASTEAVEADAILADELKLPAGVAVVVSGPDGQEELTTSAEGEFPTRTQIEAAIEAVGGPA